MTEQEERQQQEWEFIFEGVTTRMTLAIKSIRTIAKWVCIMAVVMVLLTAVGLIINNRLWMSYTNQLRQEARISEVIPGEAVSQPGSGAAD